ncbi:hypothetical protein [Erwinia pyrifoliae]|uniref:hypothetical protein n=1 Tax=Erwinia pyrifoliae TaxID=79967 RepID=UPI00220F88EC|nr:hypothetical protein [Erwinia pyrifoliae]UWS29915.1 hypothetical protein NYP81_19095 [Erwinia pyrifoliae]UXK12927.1 hypothetical protein NYP80_03285 [Erwinia pyrifoliae]
MSKSTAAAQTTHYRYYNADHPAFCGHFPFRPLLPGVYYFREILAMLPPEIACLPHVIKQAKFIKAVTPDTGLTFLIDRSLPDNTGKSDVVTLVEDLAKNAVAKIHFIFNAGEKNAGQLPK